MNLWRIQLKPDAKKGVDPCKFCIDREILGIGWPVKSDSPIDWDTYQKLAESEGFNKYVSWKSAINALHDRMNAGDLCWTRNRFGEYFLGRIDGEWEYRGSEENLNSDIVNVRPCKWFRFEDEEPVPGKVLNSFRASRTLQAIYDESAIRYSQILWNKLSKREIYKLKINENAMNIFSLISPKDCEDLVALYIQNKYEYYLIPSTCRNDTPMTEFIFKGKCGEKAKCQVKQGNEVLQIEDYSLEDQCRWFLFTTSGEYKGGEVPTVTCIDPTELSKFCFQNHSLMTEKIKVFMDFITRN